MKYSLMKRNELENQLAFLMAQYEEVKAKGLKLDMSRGKPGADQLSLTEEVLSAVTSENHRFS